MPTPAGDERTVWNEDGGNFNARAGGRYVLRSSRGTLVNVRAYLTRSEPVPSKCSILPFRHTPARSRADAFVCRISLTAGSVCRGGSRPGRTVCAITEEKFNQKILGFVYVGSFDIFNTKGPSNRRRT